MPSHIKQIGKGKYRIVVGVGRDPLTGKRKRIVRHFKGRVTAWFFAQPKALQLTLETLTASLLSYAKKPVFKILTSTL